MSSDGWATKFKRRSGKLQEKKFKPVSFDIGEIIFKSYLSARGCGKEQAKASKQANPISFLRAVYYRFVVVVVVQVDLNQFRRRPMN